MNDLASFLGISKCSLAVLLRQVGTLRRIIMHAPVTSNHLEIPLDGVRAAMTCHPNCRSSHPLTPGELIRKARIRYAAKRLRHTSPLVNKAAKRSDYESEKHFIDACRAEFSTTLSEFRSASINRRTKTDVMTAASQLLTQAVCDESFSNGL